MSPARQHARQFYLAATRVADVRMALVAAPFYLKQRAVRVARKIWTPLAQSRSTREDSRRAGPSAAARR